MTDNTRSKQIADILNDSDKMTKIIRAGVNTALLQHKRMGNPICEWRDGRVVWIQPENIQTQAK